MLVFPVKHGILPKFPERENKRNENKNTKNNELNV